jgi:L-alanine-DL-glutamate epimerase-like enolase superfamily enzyme
MRGIATAEAWPLAGLFTISCGSSVDGHALHVRLESDGIVAQGESEAAEYTVAEALERAAACQKFLDSVDSDYTRKRLQHDLPAGPIRNAIDCALWDLESKRAGLRAWTLAGISEREVRTLYTLSLDTPKAMARAALAHADWSWLKVKLGAAADLERVAAVRAAAPRASILVDVNGGWTIQQLHDYAPHLKTLGVAVIEQPLAPGADRALEGWAGEIPVCADESCTDRASLDTLASGYRMINIKLDKTGGLTEALLLARAARARGLGVMVGCNLGTSLAMAPALLIAQGADVVDLDAPLLLARDRSPGLRYEHDLIHWPEPSLWG